MAGMGPAPKPAGLRSRRNATVPMTKLSSKGRRGRCPEWPLPDDIVMQVQSRMAVEKSGGLKSELESCTDARSRKRLQRELEQAIQTGCVLDAQIAAQRSMEIELWAELWKTPQSEMWEKLGWPREVAQYVRWKVRGELGDLDAAKEARQWSDRLGLSPLAMLRLRWEMERTEDAEERGKRRRSVTTPAKQPAVGGVDPRSILRAVN